MLDTARRTVFNADHEAFRGTVRKFFERELTPHLERWEREEIVDRGFWNKCGEAGLLCPTVPERYGGLGLDFGYNAVIDEELAYAGSTAGITLHSDIVADYIVAYGSEEQKSHWLPRMVSGETVTAIAMTEPGAGSDLQAIRTAARRDGNHYVINGSKTYITNGQHADLTIVAAKTDPSQGAKGTSLILVEADRDGYAKGRNLDKIGLHSQDTSELFFNDVRLPATHLLGGAPLENRGFVCLMEQLPWERIQIAITAVSAAQAAIDWTVQYVKDRRVFGQPVAAFQNTRYKLAELQTEVQVARVFVDKCLELVVADKLDTATASMAKYWTTELQCKVMDECVQLHGGYGFMWEYPITRAYADARVQRIYGGTNEIMKEVITRAMGLGGK